MNGTKTFAAVILLFYLLKKKSIVQEECKNICSIKNYALSSLLLISVFALMPIQVWSLAVLKAARSPNSNFFEDSFLSIEQ